MSRRWSLWWFALFLLAITVWSIGINRPVDLPSWHEFDYSAIARNFVHEGGNILLPRIDWRGDGPGFTEMEFPLIPWTMAQLYRVFGVHEIIGRLLSLAFTLGALLAFRAIALKFLPPAGALIACLFFVVSHELLMVATAIQPESLMLLCYLLTVYFYVDWYARRRWSSYALAIGSFALALLIKSPAAHLAIFLFIWSLMNDGRNAFRRPSLYLFAVLSFTPAFIWYRYAASLWIHFHNSMGVSNEDHWLGLDMLRRPKVFANLLVMELVYVFGIGGFLVVVATVVKERLRSPVNRLAAGWCLSVAIYFLVILRTAGANWAAYYHVVATPPVALLFAAGICLIRRERVVSWRNVLALIALPALLFTAFILWLNRRDASRLPGVFQDLALAHISLLPLLVLTVLSFTVTVLCFAAHGRPTVSTKFRPLLTLVSVVTGCFLYFLVSAELMLGTWSAFAQRSSPFNSARAFANQLSSPGPIVAGGGICTDPGGHRVANDAPEMFYWLNRKGFTTCQETQSIAELKADRRRGARYFIVYRNALQSEPQFASELHGSFPLLAESNSVLLFGLDTTSPLSRKY